MRYWYRRISPEQLQQALEDMNLTMDEFCRIGGLNDRKLPLWLRGEDNIPHSAVVLATLLQNPENQKIAKELADYMLEDAGKTRQKDDRYRGRVW